MKLYSYNTLVMVTLGARRRQVERRIDVTVERKEITVCTECDQIPQMLETIGSIVENIYEETWGRMSGRINV